MTYRPWVMGLGTIALACLWPEVGTIMIAFLPGLLVAEIHGLKRNALAIYWPILILVTMFLNEITQGKGAFTVSLEMILMAWALTHSQVRSWTIPKTLIFTAGVFVLAMGLVVALSIGFKTMDMTKFYSSMEMGIEQGLNLYELDDSSKATIKRAMMELAPTILVITILFFAYLNCALANFFGRRLGHGDFFGPKIQWFRLPEPFIWMGIAGGAGMLFGQGLIQIVSKNLLVVVLTLYCVQGAGRMRYFMLQYRMHWLLQALVFLLLWSSWYGLLGLTVMGISDVWINVRHIHLNGDTGKVGP